MQTDIGKEMALNFNASSLNEIATACERYADILAGYANEAYAKGESGHRLDDARPYLDDRDTFKQAAHHIRSIIAGRF